MSETADLLINTGSRTAKQQKRRIIAALAAQGFVVSRVYEVNRSMPLKGALQIVRRRKPKLLIIGGGDGTISAAMDALVSIDMEIGLIPLGTTNNFARSLNIPFDIEEAIETIARKKAKSVDLGRVGANYFTNVAGVGLSAQIARTVTHQQKQRYGRLAYALVGAKLLFKTKPFFITLEDPDGELSITIETRQLIVANGRYHAGKEIADDVAIDNGQLVIFPLGGGSWFSFVRHTLDFYVGRRRKVRHASYYIGKKVHLRTSRPVLVELDGEVKTKTPINVEVEAGTVQVRA